MFIPDLESIINAITGIPSPITGIAKSVIKDKLQRNEIVIKILKQFNLAPEHPPADFSGVYAYALVEYGVGKPKPMLELFRLEQIKKAFRKALDHNNPSILLSEVDTFVDSYALGDEIKTLGLDIKREVAAFATVFIEVAKRSRTPADVLMSQQIGSLHKRIVNVQEQLDRLPTLEGIRTEMARLANQSDPVLPLNSSKENQCRAIALAQQMRGWFETLGYRFEKHEVWEEEYFEWIINIQGRRGYDRILVRGIEGEAGVKDVVALRDQTQKQRTDKGWLVSARRISRAARELIKQEDYSKVFCYTFDELIDQDADFSNYLDWLETEVKRRGIDTKYIPLACTKEEIDPVTKRRIAVSRYGQEDDWIDGYIDLWLDDPAKEHISVLGEFGTGKTWFVFHYAWNALQRYRDAQKRGVERPRLPLVITLRDYAKALNVENVLAGFFFTQHNIRLNSDVFDQLNRMGKLLLIFDGFDEMAAKVDRQQTINNFWELAKVVVPGAKVILTCRTEHFPEAKEGRALLNAELLASTANLTGETPQFEILELEKFNDEQIRQALSFQAQFTTVEQVMGNPYLLDLARRPVMTELILEALPDIEIGKPVDMSRVYLYAVRRKMERDIKAERTFTSLADKLYFLCELSWEMLSTDQMSLNYRLFPDRIRRLFGSVVQEEKDLDHWHYDMIAQTMLIRNADGDYTPAHRSLLEFFVAYKFAAELGALADDFTELAQAQSCLDESATPVDYTWSGYFARQLDQNAGCVSIAPLKAFTSEPLEKLRETFGRSPLTKAVIDLLLPMVDIHSCITQSPHHPIIKILKATCGKTEAEVSYTGGNAATLLVKVDKEALESCDLSHTLILGADFTDASLRNVNFTNANLGSSKFNNILSRPLSVAFSPDGKMFATGDASGDIRLWQATDNRQTLLCKGHIDWVRSVVFSPDGTILASSSDDQTVKIWDIKTGECLKTLQGHIHRVCSVAISPDGTLLASGSSDQTVKLWDIKTGECLKTLQGHTSRVFPVAISPDGTLLASGSNDQTVKLWDIKTSECLKTLQGHTNHVHSLVISPDGKNVASGSDDGTIKLWDIETSNCIKTLLGHFGQVWSIAISSDGKLLLSSSSDTTIKIWDLITGECLKTLQGHTAGINQVDISPDNTTVASASNDQTVKLWNIKIGECLDTLQGYIKPIYSTAVSPDSKRLASGGDDQTVRLWDVKTGKCLKNFQEHNSIIWSVAFSLDNVTLASGSADNTVKIWNINTGECLKTFQGHSSKVYEVAFSPDGATVASASDDQTIKLWDVCTGICMKTLLGHIDKIWSIAISSKAKIIASGSADKTVKLWDILTGECIKTFQLNSSANSVVFSPDGRVLASAVDKMVKLWDVYTGEYLNVLHVPTQRVRSVAFSPDSKILAWGGDDKTVRLWDISRGKNLSILQGHTSPIWSVNFSSDGKTLVSGSLDETIKLWDIETSQCFKNLMHERPYEGMNIIGIMGLTEAEKASLKALGAVESE
ncbi:MAG: NACHT domain-containing protein [Rhizonema sp. PD38]|nr:NACHT domain-containing protein [Rhizonema sp. PD38]